MTISINANAVTLKRAFNERCRTLAFPGSLCKRKY